MPQLLTHDRQDHVMADIFEDCGNLRNSIEFGGTEITSWLDRPTLRIKILPQWIIEETLKFRISS